MEVSDNTYPGEIYAVEFMKVDTATSLASILDDEAVKIVSVSQSSRKNHKTVEIVAKLDQIEELPYPM